MTDLDAGPHPGLHRQLVDVGEPLSVSTASQNVEAILFGIKDRRVTDSFGDFRFTVELYPGVGLYVPLVSEAYKGGGGNGGCKSTNRCQ